MGLQWAILIWLLFLGWAIWAVRSYKRRSSPDRSTVTPTDAAVAVREIESRFHNLLFNLAGKDKERIINTYMSNHGCSRIEAMRLYIEHWEKEQARLS